MNVPNAWRRGDLLVTAVAFAALLAWDGLGLDLPLVRLFGDSRGFAWRDQWFASRLLHDGGRWLAGAVLAAMVLNLWRPWTPGLTRAERGRWLAVTLLALVIVPLLKQVSLSSCPWDLAEFGGVAQHVSHWRWGVRDGGAGHCFPSGHATSAVAFFSGWFALRRAHPKLACAWLLAVCALGLLYGGAQMARGAHYASHTLWSAWLCWTLALVLLGRQRAPRPQLQPASP